MIRLRTMLFAPGNQARKVEKALAEVPADAIILDLEDAVPIAAKEETRAAVAAALTLPRRTPHLPVFVRVNGVDTPWLFGDLDGVVQSGLDAIMLPKTAGPHDVYVADRYLAHVEAQRGLPVGSVQLMPLIESAAGLANLAEICRLSRSSGRTTCIGFGAADFTADIGAGWGADEDELLFARSQLVLQSRLAGLDPPVDTVYPHFRDAEGLERTSRRSRDLGFQGRMVIHPDQVEPVNRIYSPTDDEVAWARDVLGAFADAEARGLAAIQLRGQLIDYAFLPRARRILAQAGSPEDRQDG